jgi:hypothetical protein
MSKESESGVEYYNKDWDLDTLPAIDPHWYNFDNQIKLNIELTDPTFRGSVESLLKTSKKEINDANLEGAFRALATYGKLTMGYMALYLNEAFCKHFRKYYPILVTTKDVFEDPTIRKVYLTATRYLWQTPLFEIFNVEPSRVLPEPLIRNFFEGSSQDLERIKEAMEAQDRDLELLKNDVITPILLIGCGYSAQSLRKQLGSPKSPDPELLRDQTKKAWADYFLDITATPVDTSIRFVNFGLNKKKKKTISEKERDLLDTYIEESDHRKCDLMVKLPENKIEEIHKATGIDKDIIRTIRSPLYGEAKEGDTQEDNEHIFLQEIGAPTYGYQGAISTFIRERGPFIRGKLLPLLDVFLKG